MNFLWQENEMESTWMFPGDPQAQQRRHKAQKAGDSEVIAAYRQYRSVWKAGKHLGMCGQSVYERLVRMGEISKLRLFTEDEKGLLQELYATGFSRGDGRLDALVTSLGRTKPFLCRQARLLGLTNVSRRMSDQMKGSLGSRMRKWLGANTHPRGMAGKHHSQGTKEAIGRRSSYWWRTATIEDKAEHANKMLQTRVDRYGSAAGMRSKTTWKQGWRTIGGQRIYARSAWEANFARYLEFLRQQKRIAKWEHEPETFWFEKVKRGTRSYLPDFRVTGTDGEVYYIEVKGWMDSRSKTKLRRMKKYHPAVRVDLVDRKRYKAISASVGRIISDWE